ncbi:aldo/keto reductase [Halostella litorea]|uniref:aldo/keto reductase n=1 Tax=Halostella litorea TaxID=2528831 RepID=UPI001091E1B3|nr:aldo/keto reductase [Halostella litorea]
MPIDALPRIGLGTYSDDNRDQWDDTVERALDVGYRYVDTAQVYENERYVGDGIAASGVDRDELFLATKTVHVDVPPEAEAVPEAIDGCLDRLGVDAVDLLYVHWPAGVYDPDVVLPAFDEAVADGRVRNVGLSNFAPDLLDEAREVLDAPLAAHQVEMHPLLQQDELVDYAQRHDHWLVAYSPLAQGEVVDVPVLRDIAEKHDATPAQVSLAWLLSKDNVAAIPKASSEAHLRENLAARDLELDDEDVARIEAIDREKRLIDPDHGPWNR